MGTADELERIARQVAELPAELGDTAGDIYADALRRRLTIDTGGDDRLSGMRRQADRLTVDVRTAPTADVDQVVVEVAAGPGHMRRGWSWLNAGTRPRWHGSGRHPGTPARRTFDDPVDIVTTAVLEAIDLDFDEALR